MFCYYLIIPTTLYNRLIAACTISALAIFAIFAIDQQIIIQDKTAIVITFLGANFIALIGSSRIYRYRRDHYEATINANKLTEELVILAGTDPLTGVLNRRKFLQLFESEFQRFVRYHGVFSLAILDLDHLKEINDEFGHHAGDLVLKRLCDIISSAKRRMDEVGRLGGDEFGLLLPATSLPQAVTIAERIKKKIENELIHVDNHQIHITTSIGVVEVVSEDHEPETLLRKVDDLLYKAKLKGRNRVEFDITGK